MAHSLTVFMTYQKPQYTNQQIPKITQNTVPTIITS